MSTPSVYIRVRDCPLTQLVLDWAAMGYLRWFSREKEDVFLCSYPKSGRTWLRFMISCYQVKLNNLDIKLDLENFTQLSPNMTFFFGDGLPPGTYALVRPTVCWEHTPASHTCSEIAA